MGLALLALVWVALYLLFGRARRSSSSTDAALDARFAELQAQQERSRERSAF